MKGKGCSLVCSVSVVVYPNKNGYITGSELELNNVECAGVNAAMRGATFMRSAFSMGGGILSAKHNLTTHWLVLVVAFITVACPCAHFAPTSFLFRVQTICPVWCAPNRKF